jgi:hypothetical protein
MRAWFFLLLIPAVAVRVDAAPKASAAFVDTQKRFSIVPAAGWKPTPLPGDSGGMIFRKKIGGVPASLSVRLLPTKPGQTPAATLDAFDDLFQSEIGYNPGEDTETVIGGFPGTKRTLSVFASGDEKLIRAVELYVVHAFGFAHIIHFETVEKQRKKFARDLDRMLAGYRPLVGREIAAPLVGKWTNTGGGPDLTLDESGSFRMGPLAGGWQSDGGMIELRIPQGFERYRYDVSPKTLTLTSPNLGDKPQVFQRSGEQKFVDDKVVVAVGEGQELTREQLIGTWRTLDERGDVDKDGIVLQLAASGSVSFGPLSGRWRFQTGRLTVTSTSNVTITYAAGINQGDLVLSGGDLDNELTLQKQ